ncbi:MAG: Uncharacterised protein [Methanobacteriota archaeon]|nr:MAG: Uncharacterised protein [Euryarchaeota archaeon]
MFDMAETLERLQNDRQFLATVLLTMFFLAIFPAYFAMGGSGGDGSMSAVADYKVEGELEYIELDNATEYIFDGETLELSFTTEVLDDASSKNIVGVEVSMSYGEDEEANGASCAGPLQGQSAADTISATTTHNSYNGSGDGQNSGGSGAHSVEVIWQNVSLLGTTVSGLSKGEIIDQLDSKGAGEGEYLIEIGVTAEAGNTNSPIACQRSDDGEEVTYSVKLIVLDLDNVTIATELETETGEEA